MKPYTYVRLIISMGLIVTGAYIFISEPESKVVARSLLVAGFVGHIIFFISYFISKRKTSI